MLQQIRKFSDDKSITQRRAESLDKLDPTNFRPIQRPYGRELKFKESHHTGVNVATIFGSTGLIGGYVVNRVCRTGSQVLIPYRGEEKAYRHMKVMGEVGQLVPIQYDIRDQTAIQQMVSHSNVVINMVSRNHSTRNFDMYESNVEIARKIAQAAQAADPDRFIYVSCIGASPNAQSAWARYKYEAEQVTRQYIPHATILRLPPVYGYDDRLFNRFGYLQNYWGFVPLLWRKDAEFRPLYVRDFAQAITNVLAMPETCGKTYELAGNEQLSWDEFVHDILFQYTLGSWKNGKFLEVPSPANTLIARVLQRATRKKLFVEDEVNWYDTDILPSKDSLGLSDLYIKPHSLVDYAQSLTAIYRRARIEDSYSDSSD